jgi:hypothetical protein
LATLTLLPFQNVLIPNIRKDEFAALLIDIYAVLADEEVSFGVSPVWPRISRSRIFGHEFLRSLICQTLSAPRPYSIRSNR